jgi:hypothetical protein
MKGWIVRALDGPFSSKRRFRLPTNLTNFERCIVFRLFAATKNEDGGYPVVLPQPIDETLATCAQVSPDQSQLISILHALLSSPQEVFSAAPLTAVASLSTAWQRLKETPTHTSSE